MGNLLTPEARELEVLSGALRLSDAFPKQVQFSKCGNFFFANVSDQPFNQQILMNTDSFTGMSVNKFKALSIALTEYVERKVCRNNPLFLNANEGVAGRSRCPMFDDGMLVASARENALNEATERYVWASWWDNEKIEFQNELLLVEEIMHLDLYALALHVRTVLGPGEFRVIKPRIHGQDRVVIIILYFVFETGGVVSGGACGRLENYNGTVTQALGELSRHANAVYRKSRSPEITANHFYDERLLFFASREGGDLARERLKKVGVEKVTLPKLEWDRLLAHQYSNEVHLYQTLFIGQPTFIGGDLKRLCI